MGEPLVLYDEDCGFCRWVAERLRRWDRRRALRFGSIQQADEDGSLEAVAPGERYASWHFIEADGRVWSAGAAIPRVLERLPGGAPLAWITGSFPSFTDRCYRLAARHRTMLGTALGQQACSVDPAQRSRTSASSS